MLPLKQLDMFLATNHAKLGMRSGAFLYQWHLSSEALEAIELLIYTLALITGDVPRDNEELHHCVSDTSNCKNLVISFFSDVNPLHKSAPQLRKSFMLANTHEAVLVAGACSGIVH